MEERKIYICPMHPEVEWESEGLCPECGMRLVPKKKKTPQPKDQHASHSHDKHKGHKTNIFKRKFWISLVLSAPVVLYTEMIQEMLGFSVPEFPGSGNIPLVLASIIFFYGGSVFITSAVRELRAKMPGMMTLIALAITVAYAYSLYAVFAGGETLFWELATLVTIMLFGHWLEMRAVSGAQGALQELSKLLPDVAEVVRGERTEIIPLAELKTGDLVLVKPGGKVPADGVVKKGTSDVNESIATGESKPVPKKPGEEVIAGTINGDGTLTITVAKIGENTFLAGVMRLVAQAQSSKSRLQILSDRAAYYLTLIAVGAGGLTLVWWSLSGELSFAVERMVAVLVIACPHALGLAVPLVASISTTKAAQNGFFIKERLALEAARNVDTVLFDKTGTLTEAKFKVTDASSDEALALAASVNVNSEHPIAAAMVEEAKRRSLLIQNVSDFKRVPGRGTEGNIDGKHVFVGTKGDDDIVVERDGKIIGKIAVADAVRPESKEAIAKLKQSGIRVLMITGDSKEIARVVAQELGLDEYFARVLPEEKVQKVKDLQNRGFKVAMVGDGVNDAPALTQADLGIAIGAGTNVAVESAGIILVKSDPRDVPKIIELSRLTYRKMVQNLFWATGYNVVAIPLAAGALAFKGILLQPALAAVFMSASTVIVALNALIFKRSEI